MGLQLWFAGQDINLENDAATLRKLEQRYRSSLAPTVSTKEALRHVLDYNNGLNPRDGKRLPNNGLNTSKMRRLGAGEASETIASMLLRKRTSTLDQKAKTDMPNRKPETVTDIRKRLQDLKTRQQAEQGRGPDLFLDETEEPMVQVRESASWRPDRRGGLQDKDNIAEQRGGAQSSSRRVLIVEGEEKKDIFQNRDGPRRHALGANSRESIACRGGAGINLLEGCMGQRRPRPSVACRGGAGINLLEGCLGSPRGAGLLGGRSRGKSFLPSVAESGGHVTSSDEQDGRRGTFTDADDDLFSAIGSAPLRKSAFQNLRKNFKLQSNTSLAADVLSASADDVGEADHDHQWWHDLDWTTLDDTQNVVEAEEHPGIIGDLIPISEESAIPDQYDLIPVSEESAIPDQCQEESVQVAERETSQEHSGIIGEIAPNSGEPEVTDQSREESIQVAEGENLQEVREPIPSSHEASVTDQSQEESVQVAEGENSQEHPGITRELIPPSSQESAVTDRNQEELAQVAERKNSQQHPGVIGENIPSSGESAVTDQNQEESVQIAEHENSEEHPGTVREIIPSSGESAVTHQSQEESVQVAERETSEEPSGIIRELIHSSGASSSAVTDQSRELFSREEPVHVVEREVVVKKQRQLRRKAPVPCMRPISRTFQRTTKINLRQDAIPFGGSHALAGNLRDSFEEIYDVDVEGDFEASDGFQNMRAATASDGFHTKASSTFGRSDGFQSVASSTFGSLPRAFSNSTLPPPSPLRMSRWNGRGESPSFQPSLPQAVDGDLLRMWTTPGPAPLQHLRIGKANKSLLPSWNVLEIEKARNNIRKDASCSTQTFVQGVLEVV